MHGQIGKDAWSIFEGSCFSGQRESESELPILAVCGDYDLCDLAWVRKYVRGLTEFQISRHRRVSNFAISSVNLDVLYDDLIGSGRDVNSCATNRT